MGIGGVHHEIDLLELCRDINEDTFKNTEKKAQVKQEKKLVQNTGQFCLTTTKPSTSKMPSKQQPVVKEENPLRPKIN